tara:strand:- start:1477 stop:2268 length:792 start_codon:yes stop_codon:yes gene_type:complete
MAGPYQKENYTDTFGANEYNPYDTGGNITSDTKSKDDKTPMSKDLKEAIGMGSAMIGSTVGNVIGQNRNKDYKAVDANAMASSDISLGGDYVSEDFLKKEQEITQKHQKIGSGLSSAGAAAMAIPGPGWIIGGALSLAGGLTSAGVFKSQNKEDERRDKDQTMLKSIKGGLESSEYGSRKANELQKNFALGGYTDNDYLSLLGQENNYAEGGFTKIENGGTHEENPNGGALIGHDEEGTPNLAEEGEIVVDLPSGQFVFTDRF